jgi:FAD/FMN-containing dehydrogenase
MESKIYYPVTTEEASGLFREIQKAREADDRVRAGIVESPYRPARTPGAGTILFSCERMKRIEEVSNADLLAVVEGGVRYSEFARAVSDAGLYFPHVPKADVTIAEMIMDGMIFPTEGAFGGLRESILSVELITTNAETVSFGSRAIKNVCGYEIIGFLLGQGGRCGMITRVTLRLLAEPCCRAYIAGRGGRRALKTLAHNLRKEFRPASIEIFEGEAADIVIDAWVDTLPSGGSKLSHLLDGQGDSLLVGELQGLEPAVEDQLHRFVDSSESEHAAFVLASEELLDVSRRYPLAAAVKREGAVIQVCYDGPSGPEIPGGSFVYRSLYPERLEVHVPIERVSGKLVDTIFSDPGLMRFVSGITGTGRREQVSIVEYIEERIEKTRIPASDLLEIVEAVGDRNRERDEQIEQARAFEELNSKVLRAFDPEGIMLP